MRSSRRPSIKSVSALCLAALMSAPAAHGDIDDLTTWDLYRDPDTGPGPITDAMTGSAAPNLAQLNFIDNVDIPQAYDVGFSSVNANTVAGATSGYAFDATQDFTVSIHFTLDVDTPAGFVAIGLGIGEDRAGFNSAGIGFGVGNNGGTPVPSFFAAATNNDTPIGEGLTLPVNPFLTPYIGSLTVAYDAFSGDVTVGASQFLGAPDPLAPTQSVVFDGDADLGGWTGADLLVSVFLRSDSLSITDPVELTFDPWTGKTAEADFFDFTVVEGTPTQVPEPTSLAMLGLGLIGISRRRRR